MKFLRTVSTRRLLATIAGLLVAVGGGTAIAVAASSAGPVPANKPLAQAVHDALAAKSVNGITRRRPVHQPSDRRIRASRDRTRSCRVRPAGSGSRATIACGSSCSPTVATRRWSSTTARSGSMTRWRRPSTRASCRRARARPRPRRPPSRTSFRPSRRSRPTSASWSKQIKLSGAIPSDVAGQAAYTVRVSPKHDGGLLGSAELAVDAVRGIPLRFAVYAKNQAPRCSS